MTLNRRTKSVLKAEIQRIIMQLELQGQLQAFNELLREMNVSLLISMDYVSLSNELYQVKIGDKTVQDHLDQMGITDDNCKVIITQFLINNAAFPEETLLVFSRLIQLLAGYANLSSEVTREDISKYSFTCIRKMINKVRKSNWKYRQTIEKRSVEVSMVEEEFLGTVIASPSAEDSEKIKERLNEPSRLSREPKLIAPGAVSTISASDVEKIPLNLAVKINQEVTDFIKDIQNWVDELKKIDAFRQDRYKLVDILVVHLRHYFSARYQREMTAEEAKMMLDYVQKNFLNDDKVIKEALTTVVKRFEAVKNWRLTGLGQAHSGPMRLESPKIEEKILTVSVDEEVARLEAMEGADNKKYLVVFVKKQGADLGKLSVFSIGIHGEMLSKSEFRDVSYFQSHSLGRLQVNVEWKGKTIVEFFTLYQEGAESFSHVSFDHFPPSLAFSDTNRWSAILEGNRLHVSFTSEDDSYETYEIDSQFSDGTLQSLGEYLSVTSLDGKQRMVVGFNPGPKTMFVDEHPKLLFDLREHRSAVNFPEGFDPVRSVFLSEELLATVEGRNIIIYTKEKSPECFNLGKPKFQCKQ